MFLIPLILFMNMSSRGNMFSKIYKIKLPIISAYVIKLGGHAVLILKQQNAFSNVELSHKITIRFGNV